MVAECCKSQNFYHMCHIYVIYLIIYLLYIYIYIICFYLCYIFLFSYYLILNLPDSVFFHYMYKIAMI